MPSGQTETAWRRWEGVSPSSQAIGAIVSAGVFVLIGIWTLKAASLENF